VHWLYLFAAGCFEISWAVCLKYSAGFSRPGWVVLTVIGSVLSFAFLALAMKSLPFGPSYAVWTGIGALGTAILGVILFGDAFTFTRGLAMGLILAGVILLKISVP
jgi:quaternary ammonium compound-resistance protein SugE